MKTTPLFILVVLLLALVLQNVTGQEKAEDRTVAEAAIQKVLPVLYVVIRRLVERGATPTLASVSPEIIG